MSGMESKHHVVYVIASTVVTLIFHPTEDLNGVSKCTVICQFLEENQRDKKIQILKGKKKVK